jgi:hypothetical protein
MSLPSGRIGEGQSGSPETAELTICRITWLELRPRSFLSGRRILRDQEPSCEWHAEQGLTSKFYCEPKAICGLGPPD